MCSKEASSGTVQDDRISHRMQDASGIDLLPVRAFLKICSKPKNLRMDKFTDGWKRRPPLYGPRAELN